MAIGKQIRKHRDHKGWTLEQLSSASGVDVGTIHALEQRDSSRSKFFGAIAKAFGLTIEELNQEPGQVVEAIDPQAKKIARLFTRIKDEDLRQSAEQALTAFVAMQEARFNASVSAAEQKP